MFLPGMDFAMDVGAPYLILQNLADLCDVWLPLPDLFFHLTSKALKFLWLQVTKSQILQLGLHQSHTQAPGQRCVDLARLARGILLLRRRHSTQRTHIM